MLPSANLSKSSAREENRKIDAFAKYEFIYLLSFILPAIVQLIYRSLLPKWPAQIVSHTDWTHIEQDK